MELSRRSFIRWVLAAGASMACPVGLRADQEPGKPGPAPKGKTLHSEESSICHQVRDGARLPMPEPEKRVDLVIIGGGPSGLAAAERAQKADFLLLEKERNLGGNAYAENWEGIPYGTGSAWTSISSSEVEDLFKRWKFDLKRIEGLDFTCFNGTWVPGFWDPDPGSPVFDSLPFSPPVRKSIRQFCRDISRIDLKRSREELDRLTFSDLLKDYAPELRNYWDTYGLSNWGCQTADTSGYVGLQAARDWMSSPRYTWEGGLGMGSERIYTALSDAAKARVRLGTTVYSVRPHRSRTRVSYFEGGAPHTVEAKVVVMATPKFITSRLIQGLPEQQMHAMVALRYAPFLVYNMCFSRVVYNKAYDNFVVGARHFTNFVPADFATYAQGGDLSRKQVITVYAPMRESERRDILDDNITLEKAQAAVGELVGMFPSWIEHLAEVRIYRRGHAMPMPFPGATTRIQPLARSEFKSILFAHSDSNGDVSDFAEAAISGASAAKMALQRI